MSGEAQGREITFLFREGSLALDGSVDPRTSPDLNPGEELRIDGNHVPYPVTRFDFRPNEDVSTIDTGHGIVRIAWDELENSGTLDLTVDDVPAHELDSFLSLLLESKAYRWLSFRGRRYRVSGFTPSYQPHEDTEHYTVDIQCVAYRPHKSLPPVPGTEIFPLVDVRRKGGKSVHDRILHVAGIESWLALFLTSGVTAFDTETGTSYTVEESIDAAGLVAFYDDTAYVCYGSGGKTVLRSFSPSKGFTANRRVIDVPFSLDTHTLQSDTLYFVDGGQLKALTFSQSAVKTVNGAPTGLRINPIGDPAYLHHASSSMGGTRWGSTFYNCPADVKGAVMSGTDRAIVFKQDGAYLYRATITELGAELGAPILDGDGNPTRLDAITDLDRFGIFGSPGLPEGYWMVGKERQELEPYMPAGADASPTEAFLNNESDFYTSNMLAGFYPGEWLAFEADPYSVYIDLAWSLDPYTYSGINSDDPSTATEGPSLAHVQTEPYVIRVSEPVVATRFWYEATVPEGGYVKAYAKVGDAPWQECGVQLVTEHGAGGYPLYEGALPLEPGRSYQGQSLTMRFELFTPDVKGEHTHVRYLAWTISTSRGQGLLVDTDDDGVLEAPITRREALLRSSYADGAVAWENLRGVHYNGYTYFAYTDQHVYQVFPLI